MGEIVDILFKKKSTIESLTAKEARIMTEISIRHYLKKYIYPEIKTAAEHCANRCQIDIDSNFDINFLFEILKSEGYDCSWSFRNAKKYSIEVKW